MDRCFARRGRHVLGERVAEHRIRLSTQIIRLLLTMVPDQRGSLLREDSPPYQISLTPPDMEPSFDHDELAQLLINIPLA